MLILTLRTDNPQAELGWYEDGDQKAYLTWEAHRQLAETLHGKINELLTSQHHQLDAINGIVVFKGPGSFTGLRIGLTVANALAVSLRVAIVATQGPRWIENGIQRLRAGEDEKITVPEYGALPHITAPRK